MLKYLIKSRSGQFILLGTFFLSLGFIFIPWIDTVSRTSFYIAIFFLGFFAAKAAIVDTVKSKAPNVDLLMILAALGAVVIDFESEGAILLLIFAGAGVLEEYASNQSTHAISELMSQVPSTAQVLNEKGEVNEVATEELHIEDRVIVAKGEQIPIDGYIDRKTTVNESALTGESMPTTKEKGDQVFAGTINVGNVFYLEVNKRSHETIFSNIIQMVQDAQNRPSKVSRLIERIESKYVLGVLIGVPLFIFILYIYNGLMFQEAFYRGMIMLTVASPCALIASATPATLSAISNGARNGVLFKGGVAMEALSTMDALYSDKTGTLTHGDFDVVAYEANEEILKEIIAIEHQSSHPIAVAIVKAFKNLDLNSSKLNQPIEEIPGFGMRKGNVLIGKPQTFTDFADPNHYRRQTIEGNTNLFVGKNNQIVGFFSLADRVREESVSAVSCFQNEGVHVSLLTGDNKMVAEKVAKEVGVNDYVASCLPKDKIHYINKSQKEGKIVGMIGDGINDAPALANADIGIAMGSGSSVAMESSDVVIVKNDLEKLFYSFKLSHKLNHFIVGNVTFSIAVIFVLILLNIFGLLNLPTAVLFHEGSTILVILNGLRLLRQ